MSAVIKFTAGVGGSTAPRVLQAVCNIRLVNGTEASDSVYSEQPITVGNGSSSPPSQLSLPGPGKYLVEVIQPRGRRSIRTILVKRDEEYLFEIPYIQPSAKKPAEPSHFANRLAARVVMSSASAKASTQDLEVLAVATGTSQDISLLNPRAFVAGVLSRRRQGHPVVRMAQIPAIDLQTELPKGPWLKPSPPMGRAWLLARGGAAPWTLISYPESWSWRAGAAPLLLRSQREEPLNATAPWSFRLEIADPPLNALLEYLSIRDWSSANAMFREICSSGQDFEYKLQEPFLAAIAAYVNALANDEALIRSEIALNFLAGNYWMSDIWIAVGWTLLRDAESNSREFVQARQLILGSVDQGLPYFTIGLRVLSDALNFLTVVNAKDQPAKRALTAVTRASLACSQDAVFTTVNLSKFLDLAPKSLRGTP